MSDQYLGEIRMFSGNYAPEGWLFCNGQILSIGAYTTLFGLIGSTFGGNGQSTFALPDLRSRVPLHLGTNLKSGTNYALAQRDGAESVTLVQSEMPAHTHTLLTAPVAGTTTTPANGFCGISPVNQYATTTPNGVMSPGMVSSVGGNDSHENRMPFFALNFIIATQGVFPAPNP